MYSTLSEIEKADDCFLSKLIQAIIQRYGILHPEEEIIFLSLPRNKPEERKEVLSFFLQALS